MKDNKVYINPEDLAALYSAEKTLSATYEEEAANIKREITALRDAGGKDGMSGGRGSAILELLADVEAYLTTAGSKIAEIAKVIDAKLSNLDVLHNTANEQATAGQTQSTKNKLNAGLSK